MKKLTLLIFLSFLGLYGLHFATSKRSHCFSPSFCLTDNPLFHSPSLVTLPSPEVKGILTQEFYFLSSGNQSYAFESADGRYVLKLVKFHTTTEPKKLQRVFDGFQLAEKIHPEHQGLAYLHFPSKGLFNQPVTLRDRAGRWHRMELDPLFFALQKKAVPLKEHLISLSRPEAEQELGKLLSMIRSDLEAGLYDQDHNIFHNTGFAEGTPMRIDFGKLSYAPGIEVEKEICKLRSERINPWLDSHFKKIPNHP
jgi:hypothetical protein